MQLQKWKQALKAGVHHITLPQLLIPAYLLNLSTSLIFGYLLFPEADGGIEITSIRFAFLAGVVIAPLIETYFIQHLLISSSNRWLKVYWPGVLTSILLFSGMHYYSLPYMGKTLITGSVYSITYMVCSIRKWNGIFYTALVHAVHNLSGLVISFFWDH